MPEAVASERRARANAPDPSFDWRRIAYLVQVSRALDRLEEEELVPQR
jgi:2-oxoisovalerate dehydrogenase E1 component